MLGQIKSLLREWTILGIGLLFVFLGLAAASYYGGPTAPETTGQNEEASLKRDEAAKVAKQTPAAPKADKPDKAADKKQAIQAETKPPAKSAEPRPDTDAGSTPAEKTPAAKKQAQPQAKPPAKSADKSGGHAGHDKVAQAPATKCGMTCAPI